MRSEIEPATGSIAVWHKLFLLLPLILVVAFATRVTFAWHQARILPANVLATVPFMQETGNIARSLALGNGFSDAFRQGTGATAWLTPVYPLLLAGVFRVFGIFTIGSFWAAVTLNTIFSAFVCLPLFNAGKKIAGPSVGAAAAWFWAIFPNAIVIPFDWIWDTSLTVLLTTIILSSTLNLATSVRTRDWCLYGLLWGFALMTNPSLALLLPFLLGWAAYQVSFGNNRVSPPVRRSLELTALSIFVTILCCAPWTLRNYRVFHRLVPLRSTFPIALWLGHNPVFDPQSPITTRVSPYEQGQEYKRLGEVAFMQQKQREAFHFIRTHRALEIMLFKERFVAFWLGIDSPFERFLKDDSVGDRFLLLANFLAALGTLTGLVATWIKWRRYAFVLSAFPVVFPLIYYVTEPYLRYRQPIDPVLMLLAALALDALLRKDERARSVAR